MKDFLSFFSIFNAFLLEIQFLVNCVTFSNKKTTLGATLRPVLDRWGSPNFTPGVPHAVKFGRRRGFVTVHKNRIFIENHTFYLNISEFERFWKKLIFRSQHISWKLLNIWKISQLIFWLPLWECPFCDNNIDQCSFVCFV